METNLHKKKGEYPWLRGRYSLLYYYSIFYKLNSANYKDVGDLTCTEIDEIENLAREIDNYCLPCDRYFNNALEFLDHIFDVHKLKSSYDKIIEDFIGVKDKNGKENYIIDTQLLQYKFIDQHDGIDEPIIYHDNRLYIYTNGVYRIIYDVEEYISAELRRLIRAARSSCGLVDDSVLAKRSVDDIVKDIKALIEKDVNSVDRYMVCRNGVVDIDTLELLEHTPNTFSVNMINANFLDCETLKSKQREVIEFFKTIMPDDYERSKLLEALALVFIPNREQQKAIMFIGKGANGKSTLLTFFESMLGKDNCSHVTIHDIENNKFTRAELDGKIANIFSDVKRLELTSTSILKAIISGDTVVAERKFQHPFNITRPPRLYFSANELPEVLDDTDAWFRRWIIIEFKEQFKGNNADPLILNKLLKQDNFDVLFSILIKLAHRIRKKGLMYADTVDDVKQVWVNGPTLLEQFIAKNYEITNSRDDLIPKIQLYQVYTDYCRSKGKQPMSERGFNSVLRRLGLVDQPRKIAGKSVKVWIGIKQNATTTTTGSSNIILDVEINNYVKNIKNNYVKRQNIERIPNLNIIFRDGNSHRNGKRVITTGSIGSFGSKLGPELDETLTYSMPCNIYYDEIIEYSNGTSNIPKYNNSKTIKIPKWLEINYKNDNTRIFCNVCKESYYPRPDMPRYMV